MINYRKIGTIRHKTAFIRLIVSHFVILCLSLGISVITYTNATRLVNEEVLQYYDIITEKNKISMDSMINNLNSVVYQVANDRSVEEVFSYTQPLDEHQKYNITNLNGNFRYLQTSDLITSIAIIFPKLNLVKSWSGAMCSLEEYYNIFLSDDWSSYEIWREFMNKNHSSEFLVSDKNTAVYYVYSNAAYVGGETEVIVNLFLDRENLLEHESHENGLHFLLYSTAGGELSPIIKFDEKFNINISEAVENGSCVYNGEQYFVLAKDSNENLLRYVYLISADSLTQRMKSIKLWLIMGIIATCLIGCVMVYWLAQKQYKPIKKTTSSLLGKFGINPDANDEYEYIEHAIEKISDELRRKNTVTREKGIVELALLKFIRGETHNDELRKIVEDHLTNTYYMVAIFRIEDASNLFYEEQSQDDNENLAYHVLESVYRDILGDQFGFEACRANDMIAIIGMDDADFEEEVYMRICEGQNLIEKEFNVSFDIMISQVSEGSGSIPKCYSEALMCTSHRFLSENSMVKYADISYESFNTGYYYPLDQERNLVNYLMLSDYPKAKNLLDKMLDYNMEQGGASPVYVRCLMYDICSTVIKTVSELGDGGEAFFENNLSIVEKIDKCTTASQMREVLSTLIMECCDFVKSKRGRPSNKIVEKIKTYVLENFTDTELSVANIADAFDMNANYISAAFKQQTGGLLWEYVTSIRIEKAQELLRSENLKVEEAAARCGYDNVRTFSRMFKKHTGINPGQFKKKYEIGT